MNTGLNNKEVLENRKKYGSNTLSKIKSKNFFNLFIESLGDPIIKILLIALGIKLVFLINDFNIFETIGILFAILISSFISTISEYGSERAFKNMQEESQKINCKVKRNNIIQEINIEEIVKNDIVLLEQGDKIPADGIIIEGNLVVDESSLTGETYEKEKNVIDDNHVYKGTIVTNKKAIIKVTNVGINTIYGKLNEELLQKSPDSPLKIRLKKLALTISKIGYIGAFLVAFSYLFSKIVIDNNFNYNQIIITINNFHLMTNYLIYSLTLVVTIIVVAVPEGLPMMITLVLSKNMKKMIKKNILVRKPVGIETAGNINILFTDKTGTLTKGKFEINEIILGNKKIFNNKLELINNKKFYNILSDSIIYNTDCIYENGKIIGGNTTDKVLFSYFYKEKEDNIKIIKTKQFNSKDKYSMSTIINGKKINLIKGAKEVILPKCKYYYNEKGEKQIINHNYIDKYVEAKEKNGNRIICIAECDNLSNKINNLSLIALITMKDEIRENTKKGLELIQKAGIQIVMITGDNVNTATSIAKELNLINTDNIILTSNEFNNMTDDEIKKNLHKIKIIARALPSDKTRIIKISQDMNLIVGMTGDGINDSPALKNADVGFAMGSGTEIAKEASDIVILDNNIESISNAILYGRTIFKSIRKFIVCQLTINLCAIGLSLIGPFIEIDTPITVVQMLWINMIMDTLTGLAFAYEPPLNEYMKEKPMKKNESIINKYMYLEIIITGLYSFILCIFFLKSNIISYIFMNNYKILSAFFSLFIFIDIFNSLNARTERINIFANIFKNKYFILIILFIIISQILIIYYGGSLFRTNSLNFKELITIILLALTVIPIDLLRKYYLKKRKKVSN